MELTGFIQAFQELEMLEEGGKKRCKGGAFRQLV